MPTVNQNDLRIKNTINLLETLTEGDNNYVFIGRPTEWESDISVPMYMRNNTGDKLSKTPENNFKDFYRTWDQIISLKKITPNNVYPMITRVRWVSGITYDMYRHDYNTFNTSGTNATNLYDARFYVMNRSRDVFVCLANNGNSPSTVEPIAGVSDEPFYTSDGYQWLKLYNVPQDNYDEHKTNNFIPVVDNEVISLPEGAIYTISVESRGDFYSPPSISYPYYFCKITGDGSDAVARVTIQNSMIVDVRIARPGQNYTFGRLNFTAGEVYATLSDLDEEINAMNPGGDDRFRSTVIISPPGGWGYKKTSDTTEESMNSLYTIMRQLGASRLGVFSRLDFNEKDFISDISFRQAGILQDLDSALLAEDKNPGILESYYPSTLANYYSVKVIENQGAEMIRYIPGEIITQTRPDPVNPSIEYVSKGTVVGWDDDRNIIKYIQDPTIHTDDRNGVMYPFSNNRIITGLESKKETEPDIYYNVDIDTSNPIYNSLNTKFVNGYSVPEVDKYDGNLLYLVNVNPVTRKYRQSERISFIITY